jgi:ABC-type polysaccharide/polyol phosphate transport system ATPase subunit
MRAGEISVDGVSRKFIVRARETQTLKELLVARGRTGAQEVWALREVSVAIASGEAVGLIGRNGSGKSTLLRLIAGIIRPTEGSVQAGGRIGSLLELGAGFHPDFTGRENVELNGALQGLSRAQIRGRFDEIVAFAELEGSIDRPVRTYSSGMTMRLGFAIAAFLEADVLLLDEVFAVGDESFQRKCFGVIAAFKERGGTILFVSHDASAVERLCDRAVLLREGRLAYDGPVHEAITRYRRALADEDGTEATNGHGPSGSGEARIVAARLVTADGGSRDRFLAGEPFGLDVALAGSVAAPSLHLEVRDASGLLVAEDLVETARLGWDPAGDGLGLRLDVGAPPLQFGRFEVTLALIGDDGRLLDRLARPIPLLVYPDDESRGLGRLEGTGRRGPKEAELGATRRAATGRP